MGQPVTHWQIVTKNPDGLATFYSTLFDWTIDADNPLGYRQVATGAGRGFEGGFWPAPPEANSFVQLQVEVGDVAAFVEKATAMGAKVIVPPQTLPEGQVLAVLQDPEGVPFCLHSPKPQG